ncbi:MULTISPECIES: multidrug effflux MFS transporter [Methanothrix]|jgi:MFS transporter, DHA1 family, multidrug resistance protein|nr:MULTISPECIES: multidrug effflux MFS transporter [unclassified Methanothrix]HNQ51624.1 multidrug effflux MFS transporter [Methanothrix soehngenii]
MDWDFGQEIAQEMTDSQSAFVSGGKRQKYLGNRGLIALIAFLSAFVPLSTDLYLPALPGMSKYFQVSAEQVNLTLIFFFIVFAAGMLFWGPLSDKYGRRPILIAGLAIYSLAGFLCAISQDINQLIAFRILQAIGGSSASAVAMAMIKDVYDSRNREMILAWVSSMVLISPMAAPVLGALLLGFTSWRGVFVVLGVIGLIAFSGSLALVETLNTRYTGTLSQSIGRLAVVLKNPGFLSLLIVFSMLSFSSMAFIASSSYIYINGFGLSEKLFSLYFAFNALGMIGGPMLYLRLSKRFRRYSIIIAGFISTFLGGLLVYHLGSLQPWIFALCLFPATIMGSCIRTPGANLMLEQQEEDTGSASALMSCFGILMGSMGMTVISQEWSNTIRILGLMNILVGVLCLCLWLLLSNRPFVKQIP